MRNPWCACGLYLLLAAAPAVAQTPPAPSADTASLRVTHGRFDMKELKNGALSSRAASDSMPTSTSIPAARRRSTPPPATGFGSRTATTTRAMPAAMIASTHGGVLPWCAHGSRGEVSAQGRRKLAHHVHKITVCLL